MLFHCFLSVLNGLMFTYTIIWIIIHLDWKFVRVLSAFSPSRSLTFSSLTVMICLGIILYKFILFGIYWSLEPINMFFIRFGKFLDPLQNFSAPNLLLFFWNSNSLCASEITRKSLRPRLYFSVFFPLFQIEIISIDLYLTSLKLSIFLLKLNQEICSLDLIFFSSTISI